MPDMKYRLFSWKLFCYCAYLFKERQYNLLISNLSEEMEAVKATIDRLASVPELSDQMGEVMDLVRDRMGHLVTSSQQYGKLKVGCPLNIK